MSILKRCVRKVISVYRNKQRKQLEKKIEDDFFSNNPDAKRELARNQQFYNAYSGKRCFILGNGPSLKEVDLSILREEYTFTVNQIARREDFPELHTNFHFWADPLFFDLDLDNPEDADLLNIMKAVDTNENHPVVFVPYEQYTFVKRHQLDELLNIHYFQSYDYNGEIEHINYTKIVNAFGTVVQWCITMAIYMGFSEIYLVGCDNTGIITLIQTAVQKDVTEYGYAVQDSEQKWRKKAAKKVSVRNCVVSYLHNLNDYERLYRLCLKHKIGIFNCTPQSAIDNIPKKDLLEVLSVEKF